MKDEMDRRDYDGGRILFRLFYYVRRGRVLKISRYGTSGWIAKVLRLPNLGKN